MSHTLIAGTLLQERYRIVRLLDQGGMGSVYQAEDQRLKVPVAIKQTIRTDTSFAKAFAREARTLAMLRHPALPTVSDYFTEGDGHFLVMQFIPGADLATQLAQREAAFPLDQVLRWADQLLDALGYLHQQSPPVIHRDIKPHNLKLTGEGRIVLLDFGLAKRAGPQTQTGAPGSLAGYTPAYAPLEQIQSEGTDARSDLFAVAATLYQLMTGRKPANALQRASELLAGRADPLVAPQDINPQIAPPVAAILLRALELDRARRPASAAELRTLLHQANLAEPTLVPGADSPNATAEASVAAKTRLAIATPPNNLPAQLTPIVGRAAEIAALMSLLRRTDCHLVTLTGPGGSGKTRLSLKVAAKIIDSSSPSDDEAFADGVFFVSLASIRDADLVGITIAQALDVREAAGQPIADTLRAYLRDKGLLLVLDNFEQVIAAAPMLIDMLSAAPRLKLLVTSREALRVRGEQEFPVPPLALPDPAHLPGHADLTQYPAIDLFVQRAQAVRSDFALTDANAAAVAAICARLDGLPLAIELAAARTRLVAPQTLLERLRSRLRLLTGGARDLPARQQTLRNTIDWSYDLLDAGEQQLFRRLAVFVGGRTLEAAEAVCNADSALPFELLDGLTSLLDKSLLYQVDSAPPKGYPEPRFMMLETIWEYAHEQLIASGEQAALRQAHAAYYVEFAERATAHLSGPQQIDWLARISEEAGNLRAALEWAHESGAYELGLRLCVALSSYWDNRSELTEGRRWFQLMLDHHEGAPEALVARAFDGAGVLAMDQGDYRRAQELLERSLSLRRALGDQREIVLSLNSLGNLAKQRGDHISARALHTESLGIRRALGDQRGVAMSLGNLGNIARQQGDYAAARALFEECLATFRVLQDTIYVAATLLNIATVAHEQGQYAEGRALYEQALELKRALGDRAGIATILDNLGNLVSEQGLFAEGRQFYEESLALSRELGDQEGTATVLLNMGISHLLQDDAAAAEPLLREALEIQRAIEETWGIGHSLLYLGRVRQSRGAYDEARQLYAEGLRLQQALEDKPLIAMSFEAIADLAQTLGGAGRAARLLGAAAQLRETMGAPLPLTTRSQHNRMLDSLRDRLGDDVFAHAMAAGRALTLDQAIAFALEEDV